MATYLRHIPTGDIYPFHDLFMLTKEFEPVDVQGNPRPPDPPAEPDFVFNAPPEPMPKVKTTK